MPSNADIFQTSFLNGLSMATAQESGKLAAMQQAAQLQYGLQSKRMDFQLDLLKMREAQAARVVEMRMAQGQHELELKKNALMIEKFEMEKSVLETKMEEDKIATAAGSLFEQYQARLRNQGFQPNSPEEIQATDRALAAGKTFSDDPRVHSRIVSSHMARKEALQKEAFLQGTLALKAIERSRSESRTDEMRNTTTERFYGNSDITDLQMAKEIFGRGASLGHGPSREMYFRIQKDIEGVGATVKPGVTPAASEAERARAAAGLGEARAIATQEAGLMSDTDFMASLASARASTQQASANRMAESASTRLNNLMVQLASAGDDQAALGVKQLRDRLELSRQATVARLQGRPAEATRIVPGSGVSMSTQGGLTEDQITQITSAQTDADLLRLIQQIPPVQKTPLWSGGAMRLGY